MADRCRCRTGCPAFGRRGVCSTELADRHHPNAVHPFLTNNQEGAMETHAEHQERHTEHLVQVRQVTQVQTSWTERERGEPGAFTLQLVLDHGVEEYILRPTAADAGVLLR